MTIDKIVIPSPQFHPTREQFRAAWLNRGCMPVSRDYQIKYKLLDLLALPGANIDIPEILAEIVKEAEEEEYLLTPLLSRLETNYVQTVFIRDMRHSFQAADIAEGGEDYYPSQALASTTTAINISKSGLAVKFYDEVFTYSQYDVVNLHLCAAGHALGRHKEQKIINFISHLGLTVFDNVNPCSSMMGCTTGRNEVGTPNGSLRVTDIEDTIMNLLTNGYRPNTIVMHPMSFSVSVYDELVSNFFQTMCGVDRSGQSRGAAPYKLILHPWVPYDPRTRRSEVYIFDSRALGYIAVDQDVRLSYFNDPRDMQKLSFYERYGLGIADEAMGIGIIKNLYCFKPNMISDREYQPVNSTPISPDPLYFLASPIIVE